MLIINCLFRCCRIVVETHTKTLRGGDQCQRNPYDQEKRWRGREREDRCPIDLYDQRGGGEGERGGIGAGWTCTTGEEVAREIEGGSVPDGSVHSGKVEREIKGGSVPGGSVHSGEVEREIKGGSVPDGSVHSGEVEREIKGGSVPDGSVQSGEEERGGGGGGSVR